MFLRTVIIFCYSSHWPVVLVLFHGMSTTMRKLLHQFCWVRNSTELHFVRKWWVLKSILNSGMYQAQSKGFQNLFLETPSAIADQKFRLQLLLLLLRKGDGWCPGSCVASLRCSVSDFQNCLGDVIVSTDVLFENHRANHILSPVKMFFSKSWSASALSMN